MESKWYHQFTMRPTCGRRVSHQYSSIHGVSVNRHLIHASRKVSLTFDAGEPAILGLFSIRSYSQQQSNILKIFGLQDNVRGLHISRPLNWSIETSFVTLTFESSLQNRIPRPIRDWDETAMQKAIRSRRTRCALIPILVNESGHAKQLLADLALTAIKACLDVEPGFCNGHTRQEFSMQKQECIDWMTKIDLVEVLLLRVATHHNSYIPSIIGD